MAEPPIESVTDQRDARASLVGSGSFQCLVVARDDARRQMIARAAAEGGWETLISSDADYAHQYLTRHHVQLSVVDLQSIPSAIRDGARKNGAPRSKEDAEREAFRALVESMSSVNGLLLMVCGNEGQMQEELWARQLGVWLYLPGVNEDCDLACLCGEARDIAVRLSGAKQASNIHEAEPANGLVGVRRIRGADRTLSRFDGP